MKVYIVEHGYDWESGGETVLFTRLDAAMEYLKWLTHGDWQRLTKWDSKTDEYEVIEER